MANLNVTKRVSTAVYSNLAQGNGIILTFAAGISLNSGGQFYEMQIADTGLDVEIPEGYEGKITATEDMAEEGFQFQAAYLGAGTHEIRLQVLNLGPQNTFYDAGTPFAVLSVYPVETLTIVEV